MKTEFDQSGRERRRLRLVASPVIPCFVFDTLADCGNAREKILTRRPIGSRHVPSFPEGKISKVAIVRRPPRFPAIRARSRTCFSKA